MELFPYLDDNGFFQLAPTFRTALEEDRFIEREKLRWRYGFGNLTGRHYFHLTQGNLLMGNGRYITPIWRDGDAYILDGRDECGKIGWDMAIFKRKEFGLSSLFGGLEPIYNAIMYPNSTTILTSCDVDRTNLIRDTKLRPYLKNTKKFLLDPGDNFIDNDDKMMFVKRGSSDKIASKILYPETSDTPRSPAKIAGNRAVSVFLDEALLHNRPAAVKAAADSSLKEGLERMELVDSNGIPDGNHAILIMGGSCESFDKESSKKAYKIIKEAAATHTKIFFVPAWMSLKGYMDESGFSLKDKALEAIYKRREELSDAGAFDDLNQEIKNRPVYLTELFDIANKGALGETLLFKVKESRIMLMNGEPVDQCNLIRNGLDVQRVPDKDGYFFIRKMPQRGMTYIAGLDPIPFISNSTGGSDFCCVVKCVETGEDVAYLSIRDADGDKVCRMWETLLMFYKSVDFPKAAPCMIERNRGEVVLHWCRTNKKSYLLAFNPNKRVGEAPQADLTDRGHFKVDPELLMECLLKDIRDNGMQFIKCCDEFETYPNDNSDILDAKSEAAYFLSFMRRTEKQSKAPPREIFELTRDSSGKTIYKLREE